MSGLIGLSGIEGLGTRPTIPPGMAECGERGGQWEYANGHGVCYLPAEADAPAHPPTFEAKSWPELTAHPSVTKIGKALVYGVTTIGGAYYYGWKGGVAGFFGTAAMSSLAGTMVYHRQPEPEYKLAMYLTAGLGAVAAAIAVPAWAKAERVR
jgi:urocanate hydratase